MEKIALAFVSQKYKSQNSARYVRAHVRTTRLLTFCLLSICLVHTWKSKRVSPVTDCSDARSLSAQFL